MTGLVLPPPLRACILAEARAATPHECCGLVEGVREGGIVRALKLHPAQNLAAEPCRFELDAKVHIALQRGLRGTGREIVGCYHSHPFGPPEPSAHDRAGGGEAGFVWLILGIGEGGDGRFAAYLAPDFGQVTLLEAPA